MNKADWFYGVSLAVAVSGMIGMSFYGPRQQRQDATDVALGIMAAGNARLEDDLNECEATNKELIKELEENVR